MPEEVKEEDHFDRLKKAAETLGEFFDTVHIFATRHEPSKSGTPFFNYGVGNWFARYGQVKEWITMEEAITRERARRSQDD